MLVLPLAAGWAADRWLGDPEGWPHPVVAFGRWIAWGERRLNRGEGRTAKGALFAGLSILAVGGLTWLLLAGLSRWSVWAAAGVSAVGVFYCLSGRTLAREVKAVVQAVRANRRFARRSHRPAAAESPYAG